MRSIVILAIGLGALGVAVPASAGTPTGPSTGVRGEVRNTSCPGPCLDPPPPAPLYTGDGLVVKIRDLATHELFAKLHPKDGTFAIDTPPGRYHVHALVHVKNQGPTNCWQGSAKNVGTLDSPAFVRLTVRNQCILTPTG